MYRCTPLKHRNLISLNMEAIHVNSTSSSTKIIYLCLISIFFDYFTRTTLQNLVEYM
jgi:hypothetical protein